jgi:hypothetical protein
MPFFKKKKACIFVCLSYIIDLTRVFSIFGNTFSVLHDLVNVSFYFKSIGAYLIKKTIEINNFLSENPFQTFS